MIGVYGGKNRLYYCIKGLIQLAYANSEKLFALMR